MITKIEQQAQQSLGIHPNKQKEEYSIAYLTMISAASGFLFERRTQDQGTDASIRYVEYCPDGRMRDMGACLDFQAKATQNWRYRKDQQVIVYNLRVENYNDLVWRQNTAGIPLILVLLCLPKLSNSFHPHISRMSLILKHAMYWYTLPAGAQSSKNSSSVTVKIPVKNLLTPETLRNLMFTYYDQLDGGVV